MTELGSDPELFSDALGSPFQLIPMGPSPWGQGLGTRLERDSGRLVLGPIFPTGLDLAVLLWANLFPNAFLQKLL